MASSISHDLRHSLAAVMANAEFLCESNLTPGQREDLYAEIRIAVNQMTELIESLLEFSRTRVAASHVWRRALGGGSSRARGEGASGIPAHTNPHFRGRAYRGLVRFQEGGARLAQLAAERVRGGAAESGKIDIDLKRKGESLEIRIEDNGPGIAEAVRDRLFEPFVSHGKENGTGMGLTVVQKILQDHGGDVTVERTSASGTTFRVNIPLNPSAENAWQPGMLRERHNFCRAFHRRFRQLFGKGTPAAASLPLIVGLALSPRRVFRRRIRNCKFRMK
jgi:signal transduction histidine kinase